MSNFFQVFSSKSGDSANSSSQQIPVSIYWAIVSSDLKDYYFSRELGQELANIWYHLRQRNWQKSMTAKIFEVLRITKGVRKVLWNAEINNSYSHEELSIQCMFLTEHVVLYCPKEVLCYICSAIMWSR